MKACGRCREVKPREEFHMNRARRDGLQSQCKACTADRKRVYRAERREEILERKRVYREANAEKIAAHKAGYYARNPHVLWRSGAAARLRAHGYPEAAERAKTQTWTREDLVARDGDQCYYCGSPATQLDHWTPLKHGGEHALNNAVLSCQSCNLAKSDKTGEEFAREQAQEGPCKAGHGVFCAHGYLDTPEPSERLRTAPSEVQ